MKVVFMGTPEFSCPTLQALIDDSEINILAVYTREPSRSGRGKKIQNSPIHNLAIKNNIKVITPKNLKDLSQINKFNDFNCDLAVIVAYGLILPKEIIDSPKYGCINLHPSLLPKFRGAAPIERTILSGDTKTATTIIKMNEGLDSGDIIAQDIFELDDKISYKDLANKFANDGSKMILRIIKDLKNGNVKYIKQDDSLSSYAKKIDKSEALLDFSKDVNEVNQKIRALNGSIGAYFTLNGERIKIFSAKVINCDVENGDINQINKENMKIYCKNGIIQPQIIQKAGKRKMFIDEFLLSNQ